MPNVFRARTGSIWNPSFEAKLHLMPFRIDCTSVSGAYDLDVFGDRYAAPKYSNDRERSSNNRRNPGCQVRERAA